jgi:hypothetical protein
MRLFFLQVLHGNTAITHLKHLAGMVVTASAYCQARQALPVTLLRRVLEGLTERVAPRDESLKCYHGLRVHHMDGSNFSMPDTPTLQAAFGQPSGQRPGCGFPKAHILALTDRASGMVRDVVVSPMATHDLSVAAKTHHALGPGDLLVADRAFGCFVQIALCLQAHIQCLFRLHQRVIVDFTPGRPHTGGKNPVAGLPRSRWMRAIGRDDQIVEWVRPSHRPRWMSRERFLALPETIAVRELRYRIEAKGYRTRDVTLVTTLLDETLYRSDELAELYIQRWEIETTFGHLKTTMGMDVLKCKSPDGVRKELLMFMMVYNLVRAVTVRAALDHGVPPDRISFVDALRWLADGRDPATLARLTLNPRRPGRSHPRVRKRRPPPIPPNDPPPTSILNIP